MASNSFDGVGLAGLLPAPLPERHSEQPMTTSSFSLTLRPYRSPADQAAIAAIHAARMEAGEIDPLSCYETVPTPEAIAAYYDGHRFNPTHNEIMAEVDGTPRHGCAVSAASDRAGEVAACGSPVVGCSEVAWWTELDGTWVYLHEEFVAPAWRGPGIERALLRAMEERLSRVAAGHPTQDKAALATNATSAEPERRALVLEEGYRYTFSVLEMQRALDTLPQAPLPTGLTLRHPRRDEYRALYQAMREAYAGKTLVEGFSEESYQKWAADPRHDPSLELLAWDEAQRTVAGLVWPRLDRGHGVIEEFVVRPAYRRRGLGRALFVAGLAALRERGAAMVRLHTLAHSPGGARQLYEQLGFRTVKSFDRYRKAMGA